MSQSGFLDELRADGVPMVAVPGSLRSGSYTRAVLEIALRGAAELGADTRILDLAEYRLPLCDGDKSDPPENVRRFAAEISRARGILLGTPEYHGSVSGVLKNALDLIGLDELEGKVVGLVGVSGGMMGARGALSELRDICRVLHAWVVPKQCGVPRARSRFEDGELQDIRLVERLLGVGRQVARFAAMHDRDRLLELVAAMGAPASGQVLLEAPPRLELGGTVYLDNDLQASRDAMLVFRKWAREMRKIEPFEIVVDDEDADLVAVLTTELEGVTDERDLLRRDIPIPDGYGTTKTMYLVVYDNSDQRVLWLDAAMWESTGVTGRQSSHELLARRLRAALEREG